MINCAYGNARLFLCDVGSNYQVFFEQKTSDIFCGSCRLFLSLVVVHNLYLLPFCVGRILQHLFVTKLYIIQGWRFQRPQQKKSVPFLKNFCLSNFFLIIAEKSAASRINWENELVQKLNGFWVIHNSAVNWALSNVPLSKRLPFNNVTFEHWKSVTIFIFLLSYTVLITKHWWHSLRKKEKNVFFLPMIHIIFRKGHDARRHHKGRRKMCCVFKKRTSVIRLIECPKDFLRNALRSVKVLQYDNFVKIVRLPLHLLKISQLHEERFLNRF